jgi:hypothetical protein
MIHTVKAKLAKQHTLILFWKLKYDVRIRVWWEWISMIQKITVCLTK